MFSIAADLRDLHMLCLLTLEVLGRGNIMSAFLVFNLLGQLSNTEEIVHSLE